MGYIKKQNLKNFNHLQVPRKIWDMFIKKEISETSFKVYIEFFDRLKLSAYNNWIDEDDNVFIKYSYEELMQILNIGSKGTISKAIKELIKLKLIIQKKGFNTSSKFYLSDILEKSTEVHLGKHSSTVLETQKYTTLYANHNNCNNNNINNNNVIMDNVVINQEKELEELTREQISKLNNQYPEIDIDYYIEKIHDYEERKNKKYTSYYLTLLNWIKRDIERNNNYHKIIKIKEKENKEVENELNFDF